MTEWNLKNSLNCLMPPIIYSNNKSQEDVTNEIIETFKTHDVVTVKGGVGSGKSVIALHLVSHYGSGIIVVPTKILERQYVDDYCGNKYHFDMGNIVVWEHEVKEREKLVNRLQEEIGKYVNRTI